MTPEEAIALKPGTTPGPWEAHTDPNDVDETYIYGDDGNMCISIAPNGHGSSYTAADLILAAAAPDLAQTIAGMEWQYGAQCDSCKRLIWRVRREDAESLAVSMSRMYPGCSYRLVGRPVGHVEVIDD